jgi:hypothetical protein
MFDSRNTSALGRGWVRRAGPPPRPRAADEPQDREHAPLRIRTAAEQRDQRRQQGRRGEHRDGDDDRAERHRAQRGGVDHPQTGQRDDDRDAREGDRAHAV